MILFYHLKTFSYYILIKQVDASARFDLQRTKMPLMRHLRTGGLKCHCFDKI